MKRLRPRKSALRQAKASFRRPKACSGWLKGGEILEIAERVATVVENSKLYERMKERDRLAALGEMAAGLAHEM